jgi:uncharacterized membrane protein
MSTQIPLTNRIGRYDAGRARAREGTGQNLSSTERWCSVLTGAALITYGLARRSTVGALCALGGGALLQRGTTGRCLVYDALGVSTAPRRKSPVASVAHGQGIKIEKSVTINRSPEELYYFWRDFENLPMFMSHLESVRRIDETRSHWVAKAPAGTTVEWDAELYREKASEFIAWRSLEGSEVNHAGSVHFDPVPGGRGTEVRVVLNYEPPGGKLAAVVAKLFGEEPEHQIEDDLHRLKGLMEAGEIPRTTGLPSGRIRERPPM